MQTCLFPTNSANIAQTPGVDRNGNEIGSFSHQENKAIDISPRDGKFYAPCDIKCIFHKRKPSLNGLSPVMSVFVSTQDVQCADGYVGKVLIMCTHGGQTISTDNGNLAEEKNYLQGQHFYTVGTDLGINSEGGQLVIGSHIHMNVKKGSSFSDMDVTPKFQNYYLKGDCFVEDLFYKEQDSVITFSNGSIPINFKTFSSTPFNPSGKPNGWNEYNGEWYYVRNGQCVTGWFQDGTSWYYLEADGKMKKGWLASGNDWFYLSPGSGVMQVNAFVDDDKFYVGADGKMVRTGWTLIGSNYYYFKDKNRDTDSRYAAFADGQKVTSTWIPGSSWFYVLSNGIMAKNCQIRENGKYFAFNNSGACLNSSGQSTAYNTTTYPIRS